MNNSLFTVMRFLVYTLSGVLFIPYLTRKFGFSAYGLIAVAGFLTQYVGLIQRCTGNAVARFLNIALNKDDIRQANEIFNTALVANIGFILLQIPILALAVWKLDVIFGIPPELLSDFRILVVCNIFVFFIAMITGVISTPVQASNRLDISTSADSIRIIIRLILLVTLIETFGARLWIIGSVDLGLALAYNLFMSRICRKLAPELVLRWKYVTRKWIRPVLNMAGWGMVTALGGYMFIKTDVMMINRFVDPEIAGVYAALLIWPNFLRQVSKQLASVLAPVYMIDFARGDLARVARLSFSSAKLLGCFVGLCVGGLFVLAEPLLELWLGAGASAYVGLFRVMLVYLVFTIGEAVLWQIYITLNKVHFTGIVSLVAGVINIVVSMTLIHFGYGAMGVAIGTAFAQILSSTFAIPLGVCREFKIPSRVIWWNYGCASLLLFVSWTATQVGWTVFQKNSFGGFALFLMLMGAGLSIAFFVVLSAEEQTLAKRLLNRIKKSGFRV